MLRLLLSLTLLMGQSASASTTLDFFEEEARVSIAARRSSLLRRTPAIVTVITAEDIKNAGAADLAEVFTLYLPGFGLANDVEGVVGANFRGFWTHEGKMLFMIDGLEVNERVFGTTQFGNHYNVDNIERIEILRGPGSVIYGGFAEIGVVNVITKGAARNGGSITARQIQMSKSPSQRSLSADYGKVDGDVSASISVRTARGRRSQDEIVDYTNGSRTQLLNRLDSQDVNLALGYKNLGLRFWGNRYRTTQNDLYGTNQQTAIGESFDTYVAELKYHYELNQEVTLIPRFEYKRDAPWIADIPSISYTNHKQAEKQQAELTILWDPTDSAYVLGGFQYINSQTRVPSARGPFEESLKNGKNSIGSHSYAPYLQVTLVSPWVDLTAGARYEATDVFGSAFVPRVVLTRVVDAFHVKAMASQSFRTPVGILPNRTLAGQPSLKAETATTYETELGYAFAPGLSLMVNGYDIRIKDPLIYGTDPNTGVGFYQNFGHIGNRGLESELRLRRRLLDLTLNYSYWFTVGNNISAYEIPGRPHALLGAPQHRFNAIAGIKPGKRLSLHPSLSYYGSQYAYLRANQPVSKLGSYAIFNLNFRLRDVYWPGLEANFGVRDVFDRGAYFPPGYNNAKGNLPGPSRAVSLGLSYAF